MTRSPPCLDSEGEQLGPYYLRDVPDRFGSKPSRSDYTYYAVTMALTTSGDLKPNPGYWFKPFILSSN